jgi:hypothetical protein
MFIVECGYCSQKINADKLKGALYACPACGAPLPNKIEPYDPEKHGKWHVMGTYSPNAQRYQIGYGTSTVSPDGIKDTSILVTHQIEDSHIADAIYNGTGVPMGYSPGEQPGDGDMWLDPNSGMLSVFNGISWLTLPAQKGYQGS